MKQIPAFLLKNRIKIFLCILSTFLLFQNVYREFIGQFYSKKYKTIDYPKDFASLSFDKKVDIIYSKHGKNLEEIREEKNSTYAKNLVLIAPLIISIIKKNPYFYIMYGVSSFMTFQFTEVLKINIERERPDKINKKSFPSGHASMTTLGVMGIYELCGTVIGNLSLVPLVYVCISRVFAKRHHITDILGGMLAAIMCFNFCLFFYRRVNNRLSK